MTEPHDITANPEVVVAILRERGNHDPYIREVIRAAILEAALFEARQEAPVDGEDA